MREQMLDIGRKVTRRLGIHRPLRALFNTIFLSRATRTAELHGIRATFKTPTLTIREQVEQFTGERDVLLDLLTNLKPHDVLWDVGAAFGMFTVFGALHLMEGKAIAFEPEPHMRKLLEANLLLNGIANCRTMPVALGGVDGTTTLYESDTPNVGTSARIQRTDYRLKRQGLDVQLQRGDSLVKDGIPAPTVLKLDIEGGEYDALLGLKEILRSESLRRVYCEVHPVLLPAFNTTPSEVEEMLRDAGFTLSDPLPRGTEYHLMCVRT